MVNTVLTIFSFLLLLVFCGYRGSRAERTRLPRAGPIPRSQASAFWMHLRTSKGKTPHLGDESFPIVAHTSLAISSYGRSVPVMSFVSAILLVVGGAVAAVANSRAAFERAGGFLLISGLIIVGAGLPLFR